MKIGIDISQVIYGTGVSYYTKKLLEHLLTSDRENSYVFFGGSLRRRQDLQAFTKELKGSFTTKIFPIPPTAADLLWNRLHIMEIEKLIGPVDVFHSSDWAQPPTAAFKVTTVHDLAALKYPRITPKKILDVQLRRLFRVREEVDRVIVPSEATKADLLEFGVPGQKIRVIYEAAGEAFYPRGESEIESVKKKFRIRGKYALTVGIGGRKNTARAIAAFEQASAGEELKFVLLGRPLRRYLGNRGLVFLGQVNENDLAMLLSGAECLIYPSLYEGFGLPVLQAFATGAPVVTSIVSSLPEIAGNAAVLVDPQDTSSIAEGIKKALRGKVGLSKKGFVQAVKFSWEKTAQETLAVYTEAKK